MRHGWKSRNGLYLLSLIGGIALAVALARAPYLGPGARLSLESLAPEGVTLIFDPTDCLSKTAQVGLILTEVYGLWDDVSLVVLRPPIEDDRARVLTSFGLADVEKIVFDERGDWGRAMARIGATREGISVLTNIDGVRLFSEREVLRNGLQRYDGRVFTQTGEAL